MSTIEPNRATVLVVDDDRSMRHLARQSLQLGGFSVEEAADGREALDRIEQVRPDLILLDVDMPEIDGFEVCRQLRSRVISTNTPVLMMTGLNNVDSIKRAYDVGATDFVVKPPNWLILSQRVRYMIRASQAYAKLRRNEARLAQTQQITGIGWWESEGETRAFHPSQDLCRICGTSQDYLADSMKRFIELVHPDDRESFETVLRDAWRDSEVREIDFRIVRPDGQVRSTHQRIKIITDEQDSVVRVLGTVQDITERKEYEQRIHHLAYYDGLTGLPNRRSFTKRLVLALETVSRADRPAALLFIDLDRFKRINDTMGHSAGDRLLCQLADRLRATVRSTDCVARPSDTTQDCLIARLGGDEFVMILSETRRPEDAARVARRALEAIARPVDVGSHEITISASIGIAVCPMDGETTEELIKNADLAMYHAKEKGGNTFEFFTESLNVRALERLVLESDLRRAIERDELILHYQPLLTVQSNRIIGTEALLRWNHSGIGLISPLDFIPIAEETGLIVPIGEWVMRTACFTCKRWQAGGLTDLQIAVNVSPRQFREPEFPDVVRRVLSETGLEAQFLILELTETTVMEDVEESARMFGILKEMGIRIAIDDFGTGYSSLSYLQRQLPATAAHRLSQGRPVVPQWNTPRREPCGHHQSDHRHGAGAEPRGGLRGCRARGSTGLAQDHGLRSLSGLSDQPTAPRRAVPGVHRASWQRLVAFRR
jgi:diguanylate cyclase (GGDEF)-like protein/PAS domain S-box-containing protein